MIETVFELENTRHEYRVIRLWEEDPELFLNDPALLPFAALTATSQAEQLLQQVAQRMDQLEPAQRQEVSAYTQILAGLKFEKAMIRQLFREEMMRESVIYQEILEEGLKKGESIGEIRGKLEAKLEAVKPLRIRGFSDQEITEILGLTMDQVQSIPR